MTATTLVIAFLDSYISYSYSKRYSIKLLHYLITFITFCWFVLLLLFCIGETLHILDVIDLY